MTEQHEERAVEALCRVMYQYSGPHPCGHESHRPESEHILSAIKRGEVPGVVAILPPSKCNIDDPCRICGEHHHPAISAGWHKETIAALRGRVEELTRERDEALSGEHGNATELAALRKEYLCRQCHGSGVVHDPESGADYCEACVVGREMGQQAEVEEYAGLADRLGRLLTGVANGLKGDPGPLTLHDWSDLPKVSAALRERARVAEEERDQAIAQRDAAIVERDGARGVLGDTSDDIAHLIKCAKHFASEDKDAPTEAHELSHAVEWCEGALERIGAVLGENAGVTHHKIDQS